MRRRRRLRRPAISCSIPNGPARSPPPREDELEKLDELPFLHETSRLSCQIIWSDELDGLEARHLVKDRLDAGLSIRKSSSPAISPQGDVVFLGADGWERDPPARENCL